jgi:hypothetical protein
MRLVAAGTARRGMDWHGTARRDAAWSGEPGASVLGVGGARLDQVRPGPARRGRLGVARPVWERFGIGVFGEAGKAWRGGVRNGEVWLRRDWRDRPTRADGGRGMDGESTTWRARHGEGRHGLARAGCGLLRRARFGKACRGARWCDRASNGAARHGRRGTAWLDKVQSGRARSGQASKGMSGVGSARQARPGVRVKGMARHGWDWPGRHGEAGEVRRGAASRRGVWRGLARQARSFTN